MRKGYDCDYDKLNIYVVICDADIQQRSGVWVNEI